MSLSPAKNLKSTALQGGARGKEALPRVDLIFLGLGSIGMDGIGVLGFGVKMRGGEPELGLSTVKGREWLGREKGVV